MSKKDKKVIQLTGDNYSVLINEFAQKFNKNFPSEFDKEDVIQFAIQAWNLANVKKILPEGAYQEIMNPSGQLEGAKGLFDRMIKYKNERYSQFDKFILGFELGSENGSHFLDVSIGDYNDFMKMMEDMLDEMDEDDEILDRNAIIIKPRKPFTDWARKNSDEYEYEFFMDSNSVYLVNDEYIGPEEWLENHYEEIFERELENWIIDENLWPQNRTLSMFRRWFKIDYSLTVYDLER